MFRKMLIAGRGGIAVRVLHACRELGIGTVAVHGRSDVGSRTVRLADESFDIGRAQADPRIHLQIPALITAAVVTGTDAIHPGYGTLSLAPSLAEICADYGITCIGPGPDVMDRLGSRVQTRRLMRDAGLPIVPGSEGVLPSFREAGTAARRLGYPIVLKPDADRDEFRPVVVRRSEDLEDAYEALRRSSWGGSLYLEKFIESHCRVEVQVLCDSSGHGVHLGERVYSLRWRDRWLIAESPSAHMGPDSRQAMCDLAVRGALAAGCSGPCAVEFILDSNDNFYFAGMGTRIQAEHPITEMASGIDLVREQIRLAAGERLQFAQEDIRLQGHAIGCRIEVEDSKALAADRGVIRTFIPASGPGTRVDTYIYSGCTVSLPYDPPLATVSVSAEDRRGAIDRMLYALSEMAIEGIETTIPLLRCALSHPAFRGDSETHHVVHAAFPDGIPRLRVIGAPGTLDRGQPIPAIAGLRIEAPQGARTAPNGHHETGVPRPPGTA